MFVLNLYFISFTLHARKPVLPIEQELLRGPLNESDEDYDIEEYIDKMKDLKQGLYEKAHRNINLSQIRQKTDYDKKLKRLGVCFHFIDCSTHIYLLFF